MMRGRTGQRGVSLIEAVVAVGVMAFGMLALVGVQATLRGSGDLARQRNEAMRIAQETMEGYRGYAALTGTAGLDFDEIVDVGRAAISVAGTAMDGRLNTTFYSTISAPIVTNTAAMKPVAVTVDWTDRSGMFQSVELRSLISGVPPELAGSLALPPAHEAFAAPHGRHGAVPLAAFSLPGVGLSVFKPPQAPGGTVAWVFNNVTGLVTGLCTLDATLTNATLTNIIAEACVNTSSVITAQLLSGYVRFAGGDPSAGTEAEEPTGRTQNLDVVLSLSTTDHPSPPVCFDDATAIDSEAAARREVAYYCLVYKNVSGTWAGRARLRPLATDVAAAWTIADTGPTNFKVCRYTPLNTDTGTHNIDHPLDYTAAGSAAGAGLVNQNFLVIGASFNCPTETPVADDPFNANTRLHQNGISPYTNP